MENFESEFSILICENKEYMLIPEELGPEKNSQHAF